MALNVDITQPIEITKEVNGQINEEIVKLIRQIEGITNLTTLQVMIILQHKLTTSTQNLIGVLNNEIAQNN